MKFLHEHLRKPSLDMTCAQKKPLNVLTLSSALLPCIGAHYSRSTAALGLVSTLCSGYLKLTVSLRRQRDRYPAFDSV